MARSGGEPINAFGFEQRVLGPDLTTALVSARPEGVSVNDRMLAALVLAIDRWNRDHGEPAKRISIMMPVNARPREWWHDLVGMYAIWVSLSTGRADRSTPQRAVQAIAEQTNRFKGTNLAAHLTDVLEVVNQTLPVGVKRRVAGLLPVFDHRFMDTAVLSNLGRLPEPLPRLAVDDAEPETWFSPPCAMPLGVGIGVVTIDKTVHVVTRYRREQFDPAAGSAFADLYEASLAEVVGS